MSTYKVTLDNRYRIKVDYGGYIKGENMNGGKKKSAAQKKEDSFLWQRMKEKHISAIHLAERLGIQRQTVYKWIYGSIQIPKARLDQIAEVLDCHPAYLIYKDDFSNPQGTTFDSEQRFVEIVVEINRQVQNLKKGRKKVNLTPQQYAKLAFRASQSDREIKDFIREHLELMVG